MGIWYLPFGHVLLNRMQVLEVFRLVFKIPLEPTITLILQLTFGYHQVVNNRPILDSLETVWDRAVSLHFSCAVSDVESSWARRFHRDNIPIHGGHSQFTCLSPQPCGSGSSLSTSNLCPLPYCSTL